MTLLKVRTVFPYRTGTINTIKRSEPMTDLYICVNTYLGR
uniref:Uncharacterized protein n=1 Tax=Anguilla anguilla TaxID=7936 RepID=A0A0E9V061_ANGAN